MIRAWLRNREKHQRKLLAHMETQTELLGIIAAVACKSATGFHDADLRNSGAYFQPENALRRKLEEIDGE